MPTVVPQKIFVHKPHYSFMQIKGKKQPGADALSFGTIQKQIIIIIKRYSKPTTIIPYIFFHLNLA